MQALRQWQWVCRSPALVPCAAVGWGRAAALLYDRLLHIDVEGQTRVQVAIGSDVIVVLGEVADLPWVEGIAYAAPSPDAPSLWLPTVLAPDIPADLLAQRFIRRYGRQPLLLWPDPACLVPLDQQVPVSVVLQTGLQSPEKLD